MYKVCYWDSNENVQKERDATSEEVLEIEGRLVSNSKKVPEDVAMWQARDLLIKYDLLDNVIATIAAIQDPVARKRAESKFEFSNTVRRNDSLLNYVMTQAGFTADQVDDWFIEAHAL